MGLKVGKYYVVKWYTSTTYSKEKHASLMKCTSKAFRRVNQTGIRQSYLIYNKPKERKIK